MLRYLSVSHRFASTASRLHQFKPPAATSTATRMIHTDRGGDYRHRSHQGWFPKDQWWGIGVLATCGVAYYAFEKWTVKSLEEYQYYRPPKSIDEIIERSGQKLIMEGEEATDRSSIDKSSMAVAQLDPKSLAAAASINPAGDGMKQAADNEQVADMSLSPLSYVRPLGPGERFEFPSQVPYLIVGGGAAGMAAARAIRVSDPLSQVLIVSAESSLQAFRAGTVGDPSTQYPPYSRPVLSKQLWRRSPDRRAKLLKPDGDMREHSRLFYEPSSFFLSPETLSLAEYGGVGLSLGDPVVLLDPDARWVQLASGRRLRYDQCLLATGGRPRRLPQLDTCSSSGADLVGAGRVSYFRGIEDYKRLQDLADNLATKPQSETGCIAIVGGGLLGSELAYSLSQLARNKADPATLKVIQVYREDANLAHLLPDYLAGHTREFLRAHGVHVISGREVSSVATNHSSGQLHLRIRASGRSAAINDEKEEDVVVDHIVVAVGIEANTDLAANTLETDRELGGYLVNAELSARRGLFVAGDAASYFDPLLGRRRVEHVSHAEESGQVAGRNMAAGARRDESGVSYQHQTSFWTEMGQDLTLDAVGLVDARRGLDTFGFFADALSGDEIGNNPGVVFYLQSGRLVGILLWKLPDELWQDEKYYAPRRLNLARHLLAQRLLITNPANELRQLAQQFDLYQTLLDDFEEMKKKAKVEEEANKEEKPSVIGRNEEPKVTPSTPLPV